MIYYDLKQEAKRKSIGDAITREAELRRMARTLKRQYNNNIIVRGESGTGKTALVEAFFYRAANGAVDGGTGNGGTGNGGTGNGTATNAINKRMSGTVDGSINNTKNSTAINTTDKRANGIGNDAANRKSNGTENNAKNAIFGFENYSLARLDSGNLKKLFAQVGTQEGFNYLSAAFKKIPERSIIFIDDFENVCLEGRLYETAQVLDPFFKKNEVSLILAMTEKGYARIAAETPGFLKNFEEIRIAQHDSRESEEILRALSPAFEKQYGVRVRTDAFKSIVELAAKMNSEKKFPLRAIHFLDECLAFAKISGLKELSKKEIREIYSEKTGVPLGPAANFANTPLGTSSNSTNAPLGVITKRGNMISTEGYDGRISTAGHETVMNKQRGAGLKKERETRQAADPNPQLNLEEILNKNIIGQKQAAKIVAAVVRRSIIGLRNPGRPNGSFLFLGPSGVGKTELSKVLAKSVFGSERAFVRIDMSEFSEAHAQQRLIGAPPGYIGFESGGQLTNAVLNQPYSLILLDEIEKAHPKIFDIFLQVLEDGRLTDGQGQTVNFSDTIIIATSNLGIAELVDAFERGENVSGAEFLKKTMMPILTQNFKLEFLNRFDAIIVFNPLGEAELLEIARAEIRKIEERAGDEHGIKFKIDPEILREKIRALADYRFGARPVKRFIEDACETLLELWVQPNTPTQTPNLNP